jgi:molecular chaperone HtpG
VSTQVETLEFQAEARQLLQLMVHSIYSNKDTFLRELISNASDALDKLRIGAFLDKDLDVDTTDLHVDLELDPEARTLTVRDNGIGMSREEVVGLIGTIAKSGTAEMLKKLKESKDSAGSADLIGQFGVGFYASFMVADKVVLITRKAGETEATRWESAGEGTYTIEAVEDAPQGTSVQLFLKPEDSEDGLHDYTAPWRVRQIVKQYSDFIAWPIRMIKETPAPAEGEPDAPAEPELETVNSMKALWARPKDEVDEEEYKQFYKHVSHDWQDPLETISLKAEGTFEYQALLFIPEHAPMDLYMQDHRRGIQLYVKRVFIMDDCEALVPEYLRFVKGVVDAQDLSLNVSREILQQDRQIQMIRKRLVRRVLSTIKDLQAGDAAKYRTLWTEFGRVLKEGLLGDFENRETILELSSFASSHHESEQTSLRDYVSRMKDGQQHIYYMTGDSRSFIESSPHLEAFRDKGFEVLFLTDPVDEVWVDQIPEFDGKPLQSIVKGEVDLDTEDSEEEKKATETRREEQKKDFADLLGWMSAKLAEDVKEVRLSSRLTTSPACIVGDVTDATPALERMYRAMGQPMPHVKRILELNPTHPLVTGLRTAHTKVAEAAENTEADADLAQAAHLVYGMALLAEGGELADPSQFIRELADRLARTL